VAGREELEEVFTTDDGCIGVVDENEVDLHSTGGIPSCPALPTVCRVPASNTGGGSEVGVWLKLGLELCNVLSTSLGDQAVGSIRAGEDGERRVVGKSVVSIILQGAGRGGSNEDGSENGGELHFDLFEGFRV